MKTTRLNRSATERGYALATVMVFGVTGVVVLAGVLRWNTQNSTMIDRNNQYFKSVAAAEAATEKVLTRVASDYQTYGAATVESRMDMYRLLVPTSDESSEWGNYAFNNAGGAVNRTHVQVMSPWTTNNAVALQSQYTGLNGFAGTYRIVSNARELSRPYSITGAIQQDIQLATIPLFQFAIFYNMDLEINPGPTMTVKGRVHSNGMLYSKPGATLTFNGDVTAVKQIVETRMPGDPVAPGTGSVAFNGSHDGGVTSLNLPIGTDNSPASVHAIIEVPPAGELPTTQIGQQRLFNKADMIVQVTDTGVLVNGKVNPTTGALGTTISYGSVSSIIKTNVSFVNKRENKTINAVEIDVGLLATWSGSGISKVNTLFVVDKRSKSTSAGFEPGVRLVNGATLPDGGLTVATPNPLYVQGNYNATGSAVGTSDTSTTKPAALIADAITVLSTAWTRSTGISSYTGTSGTFDQMSGSSLSYRTASPTTVNAAFLAGIVPTSSSSYSGGVENFPRFLEDWSNKTFTYNGSMIVMFPSQFATGLWVTTGGYYNPPVRNWNFDDNFRNPTKLPPNTPAVRTVIRGQWSIVPPNSTTSVTASVNY